MGEMEEGREEESEGWEGSEGRKEGMWGGGADRERERDHKHATAATPTLLQKLFSFSEHFVGYMAIRSLLDVFN